MIPGLDVLQIVHFAFKPGSPITQLDPPYIPEGTMLNGQKTIATLFDHAEIQLNGPNPWDPKIHNNRFYTRIVAQGSLGLGKYRPSMAIGIAFRLISSSTGSYPGASATGSP